MTNNKTVPTLSSNKTENEMAMNRNYARPIFQHRHYASIAKVLADQNCDNGICRAFSDMFRADNPSFIPSRFMAAARGEPVNGKDAR